MWKLIKRFLQIFFAGALIGWAPYLLAAPTLVKSVDNYTPKVLDTYRYHIVYDNVGGSSAATTITDVVPAGVSVVGISAGGTLSAGTITWNLGAVSCQNATVTLNVWGDTSGAWGTAAQVASNDTTWATSTTDAFTTYQANVFYLNVLTGYSVSSVSSVKLFFVWHKPNTNDNVVAKFSNDGDDSTFEGAITLTAGNGQSADVTEVWDITGASTWNLSAIQRLHPYIEHQSGGTSETAYMNQIYAVVAFQSCGKEVWFDGVVTNSHKNGDVVSNTGKVSVDGASYTSNTVPVTVKGPVLTITKSAEPTMLLPGATVEYHIHYAAQITGLSVYDDFNDNLGTDSGSTTATIFPGWSTDHGNSGWTNTGGIIYNAQNAYYMLYRTDTPMFSDGTVSMDFLLGTAGSGNASIEYLYNPADGKFYKSKVYHDASGNYFVDVQTGPTWLQVCGSAPLPGFNPNIWHNIKVVILNYVFSIYIDNVLTFTCDDPTNYAKRPGYAGIYNDGGGAQYDNYRIGDDVNAINVKITDTLQSGMVYVSATPVATVSGSLLTWAVSLLGGGQAGDITYDAVVPASAVAGSVIPNYAAIAADNAQVSITGNAAITVLGGFTKTANPTSVPAGSNVTYTLSYQVPGGGVSVTDDFSSGTWAGKWISAGQYNTYWVEGGGAITCTTWGPDALMAIGSDGVNGTASVSLHLAAGSKQGLVFGYQGGKYYYVAVNSGYGNPSDDTVGLYYYNGTTSVTVSELTNQAFEPNSPPPAWVFFKVVRGGNQFFVYYNGNLIATFTDTNNYLPGAGTQGLYESAAPVAFDNFDWEPNRVGTILTDTLPTHSTYVSSNPSASVTTGPVIWDVADAAPGSYVTVTLVTQISAGAPSGPVTNCAARQFMTGAVTTACAVVTVSGAVTPTFTPTSTFTPTLTPTRTNTFTPTPSPTTTFTFTATRTNTITSTPTPSPTVTFTSTPTVTSTSTFTATPTFTRTNTSTSSPTPTPTWTATSTPTATSTSTRTNTLTPTATSTSTPTATSTPTRTPTATATSTPTATTTWTSTATPTSTRTNTPTSTFTSTFTSTATSTSTATKTNTSTNTATPTITSTPTSTNTGTSLPTNTYTVTNTATRTSTSTATPTATNTSTRTNTSTPTSTSSPTMTPTATPSPTPSSTATATLTATRTSTPTATSTPTITSTATWTNTGTNPPTSTYTVTSTPTRTSTPTATPTATSTPTSTSTNTSTATATPTSTSTQTSTSTNTATATSTVTNTSTATTTRTATSTATSTSTPTVTNTATESFTPTMTNTGTNPPTDTYTVTNSPTATMPDTNTPTASNTSTPTPSQTPTFTDTPTRTWTMQFTPTVTDTATPTGTSTRTPTSTGTATFTSTSTDTSTPTPTNTATDTDTSTNTPTPSDTATDSFTPTVTPTGTAVFTDTLTATPTLTDTFTSTWTDTATQTWTDTATSTSTWTPTMTETFVFTYTETYTPTASSTDTPTFTLTSTATLTNTLIPTDTWTVTQTPTITETQTVTPTATALPPDTFFVSRNVCRPGYDDPQVFVRVRLSQPGYCSVKIYNSAGELVRELWNTPVQTFLERDFSWDGKNMNGAFVASGVYVIYYTNRYQTKSARILVLK
jgi:hypothetical protein